MAGFTQIIEMQTSRIDEVEALIRELRNRLDDGRSSAPRRGTITADRDREGFYLSIVEFVPYEAAMEKLEPAGGRRVRRPVGQALRRSAQVLQPRRTGDLAAQQPVSPAAGEIRGRAQVAHATVRGRVPEPRRRSRRR